MRVLRELKNFNRSENMYYSTSYHLPKTLFQFQVAQLRYSVVPIIVITLYILFIMQ